jgi:hypothetical protein
MQISLLNELKQIVYNTWKGMMIDSKVKISYPALLED